MNPSVFNNNSMMLSCERLQALCEEQNSQFRQTQQSDGSFCFELLRRAVFQIDDAVTRVLGVYQPWMHTKLRVLYKGSVELDDLVQDTFVRFFRYVTPSTWAKFGSLAQVLTYMEKCGQAVVFSHARKMARKSQMECELPDEDIRPKSAPTSKRPIEDRLGNAQTRTAIWQCVSKHCNDEADRFLVSKLWLAGMKPRTIANKHPDLFPKVSDIYKRKRNLIDRIRRDPAAQAFVAHSA